jgi:hypothetical protein
MMLVKTDLLNIKIIEEEQTNTEAHAQLVPEHIRQEQKHVLLNREEVLVAHIVQEKALQIARLEQAETILREVAVQTVADVAVHLEVSEGVHHQAVVQAVARVEEEAVEVLLADKNNFSVLH